MYLAYVFFVASCRLPSVLVLISVSIGKVHKIGEKGKKIYEKTRFIFIDWNRSKANVKKWQTFFP